MKRLLNSVGIVLYLLCLNVMFWTAFFDPKFNAWCERSLFRRPA